MEKNILGYLAVLIVGVLIKVVWDWVKGGQVKKEAPYVTAAACEEHRKIVGKSCEEHREKCCVVKLKRDAATYRSGYEAHKAKTDERLDSVEKRLDQGSQDFREVKKELGAIREVLAGMKTLIETKIEKIVTK